MTYGLAAEADLVGEDVRLGPAGSRFAVVHRGKRVCEATIPAAGRHNVLNALAAAAVGLDLDLPGEAIAGGLAAFAGIERRLDAKGTAEGIRVLDDYAHHPTEIRATIEALRLMAGSGGFTSCSSPIATRGCATCGRSSRKCSPPPTA